MPGSDFECRLDPELGSLVVDQYVGDTDEHGCYSGYGEASFRRSGNTYAGEFRRGTMDGRGRYVWVSNGTTYEGDFSKNELVGTGRYTWSNGSSYQGGVSNSLRNGEGVFISADSTLVYEGFWKDGKRNGHGVQRYGVGTSCVSTYVGEWQENFRHGRGTMTYASGNTYEGDWVEGRKEGEGIMTWVHRRERYMGEWKADKQRGYGEHVWIEDRPNNSVAIDTQKQMCNVYKGQWLDGMRHDQGTFLYADGSRYVGYWLRNKKHGPAVFTSANGSTYEGRFEDDFMVDKILQDYDHPELSSAIKFSITDIIPCGQDADTTRATVREVERSALQINSDLRLAYKLYAKAGANAPRDSNMFTMSLQQFVAFAGDCRALAPCTPVTAGEVYRMFFRMERQHAWELTRSLKRVLRDAPVDGGDISAASFGGQAGSSLAVWLPKRDAEDEIYEIYDPRKAITFREFVEGVVRLATMIGDMSNGGGARLFPRANTELPTTPPPSTAVRTAGSRVTNAGSRAAPRSPKLKRVDMAPFKAEGFMTGNTCAEACLVDNTDAPAEVSVNGHFKRFVDEHLRGLFSVLAESPGFCIASARGRGYDRVGSKEAVRFESKTRGQRWENDVETDHMASEAEELQRAEAQVNHLYSMYSGPSGNLMTLRGLLRMFRDADLKRRSGLTSAEIKEVFSQANASLKSHAGAESQGVPQNYSCNYEAPSEDNDVEGSSETSDSTINRLTEPGRSTTTAAPAVDLDLLDQELMSDQFKIVVAELVKILRVKATTPVPLESSYDGPAAGSGAGGDGEDIAEGANVTENEPDGGKDGSPGRATSGTEKGQEKYHQTSFTMEKRVSTGGTDRSQSAKGASPSQDLSPGYRDEPIPCPPWLANPSVFVSKVSAWAERGNIKRVRRVARRPTPNRNFAQHITLERASGSSPREN